MAEANTIEPVRNAGYVKNHKLNRNQERIEQEEAELKALEETQGEAEEEEEEPQEKPEAEPTDPEEKSFKKRYGDLRRHVQEKEAQWKEKFNELEEQIKNTGKVKMPASDEDLDAWKKKYPDVAGIVERLASKIADERFTEARMSIDEIRQSQKESKLEKGRKAIKAEHPDFDELNESDEFHTWLEEQTTWIQKAMYENTEDPKAAIRVLDLYKADKGMTKSARRAKTTEAAMGVKTRSRTDPDAENMSNRWSESRVDKIKDLMEYEKHEEAIMAAMADGTFVYDISGGAR